jgi:hypothetical protein
MRSIKAVATIEVILILAGAVSLLVVGGCGSTQLVNLWKDSSYNAAPLKKVLVVAMRKDQLRRRMWEDAFVSAIREHKAGTVVVPSYELFPEAVPDTLALQAKTREEGFDGVLVVARVRLDTLKTDVPSYTSYEPVTVYKPRWNTYVTYYDTIYHPGFTESQTVVSVRTDLLLAQKEGSMVWSATSKRIDPASHDQFRNSVADIVTAQLMKDSLVR